GDEAFFAVRLGQKSVRSRLERALPQFLLRKGRDEDDWRPVAASLQPVLEIKAAHAVHAHVGDHTRRLALAIRTQEIFGGRKRRNAVAKRLQKLFRGLAHSRVVVDDGNQRATFQVSIPLFRSRSLIATRRNYRVRRIQVHWRITPSRYTKVYPGALPR